MDDATLSEKLSTVLPHLDERQKRVFLAAEARALGHGGITRISQLARVSRPTIHRGLAELDNPTELASARGRVRKPGGGRKHLKQTDCTLAKDLERLVEPGSRGDPMSPLRWTCKSVRQLADALRELGHRVSYQVVSELLHEAGYSLQANAKCHEGSKHPDRDGQFVYINEQVQGFLDAGYPVVSVDAKKKELLGAFKNGGREWRPKGRPDKVNVYDFPSLASGKAIPYGIYDVARNEGWVAVGCDHDTASFAVQSLRRWWRSMGVLAYPEADRLLICADGGGSNGHRVRLWKVELQEFARQTGLNVTVCHFPPGTSKWNKIEHRLFSHISMNWRGRPLESHDVVVQLISATTTRQGLSVKAELDPALYPTKIKVSDQQMKAINLRKHDFHGEWNYTIASHAPEKNM